jgi:2-oxoisovalerate dehydrogenase E1 component alpha subunit
MSYTAATVQLLSPEGTLVESDASAEYLPYIEALSDDQLREFHRNMVVIRRFDLEATNLQRQGELGMWVPSIGQEAAQVGSGFAARPQDHIFPAYREHAVARIRGVDLVGIMGLLRGTTHGGWNPAESNNFHLYTLVIGSHTLHATGRAMAMTSV